MALSSYSRLQPQPQASTTFPKPFNHRLIIPTDWKLRGNVQIQRSKRRGHPYVAGMAQWNYVAQHWQSYFHPNYHTTHSPTLTCSFGHQKTANFEIITNKLNTLPHLLQTN